ncbi:transcription termination factor MTERF8, chloroplastic-like [Zingiber officinale]|uniref:Mitochondrial transcription termination factor family protein n=1 Tax=Zingiber officinale TaxID=94328 RepID=A0A8J5KFP1_ZINOF|nr:transcription termination factor MTERF8, chloroplastic-like [Zingiber officinale]KAG6488177.1 hypothetical protein ZIOFF_056936 [Zingiber officinale]
MFHSLVRRRAFPPPTQLRLVSFSTGASASSSGATASPDPHFLAEYLVDTCGFSADDASKVSKSFRRFRSTEKPDAVLGFFRSQGLDGANLRKIISWKPRLLGWDVETNLAPKFNFLRDMGFSVSDAVKVVMRHPGILSLNVQNTLLPRLKVWESLFGSREILLKNLRRRSRFICNNDNLVRPNLNFLRDECGIPEEQVFLVIKRDPSFMVQNLDAIRALVNRADEIGIPRESRMFLWIVFALRRVSREKFEARVKIMNSFGWSNSDYVAVVKKHPTLIWVSTEALQRKMEFLIKDVGMAPLDIAKHSTFLDLSLEKRLIPRFHVMEILKSEGLWTSQMKVSTLFSLPGPKFLQKYVLPYKDKLPKLLEVL